MSVWLWLTLGAVAWLAVGLLVGLLVGGMVRLGETAQERALKDDVDGDWLLVEFDRIEWPWRGEDRTAA